MKTLTAPRAPLEIVTSIDAVDPGEWDALTDGHVLASHGWLAATERWSPGGAGRRYVLARRNGRLTGAAMATCAREGAVCVSPDALLLGRLRGVAGRAGVSFLPAYQSGAPFAFTDHVLGPDRAVALAELERIAAAERLPVLFPRVAEMEESPLGLLAQRGYARTLTHPTTYLDVEWDSFRGYLKTLKRFSRNVPRAIRNERNRFANAGLRVEEIHDVDRWAPRLHALADRHHRRLNGVPFPFGPEFILGIKDALRDRCVVYGAFRGEALLGFSLLLWSGEWGHVPFVGIADEALRENFVYFNVGYYRPIEDAPALGIKRLYYGTMAYALKARRGCRLVRTHLCYRGPTAVRHAAGSAWIRLHRVWAERRKFARFQDLGQLRKCAG